MDDDCRTDEEGEGAGALGGGGGDLLGGVEGFGEEDAGVVVVGGEVVKGEEGGWICFFLRRLWLFSHCEEVSEDQMVRKLELELE